SACVGPGGEGGGGPSPRLGSSSVGLALPRALRCQLSPLLARIERMERRVQLVKKDSEREKHRIFQGFEVDEKPEAETCEKLPLECPQDLLEPTPTLQPKHFPYGRNGKGHKRKPTFGSAERKTPVKKLVSEFSKVKSKTPKHSPGKEESSGSLSETVCKRELRSQETPEKPRSLLETPLRASVPLKGPGAHPKEKGFFSSETDDLPYLSTTEMYLCRWHQPPPSPLPLREPSPKKEETVASKRWRARRGAGTTVPGVGAKPAAREGLKPQVAPGDAAPSLGPAEGPRRPPQGEGLLQQRDRRPALSLNHGNVLVPLAPAAPVAAAVAGALPKEGGDCSK
uniref:MSL1 protein n=1 Tax=Buteo japonicus TaxID=224669 RepID=A0A8B9ZB28_9AVES